MDPNVIFHDFTNDDFTRAKNSIAERFTLTNKPIQKGTREAFEIKTTEGKINFTYYNNGKFMVQSSPSNTVYASIVNEFSKMFSKTPTKREEIIPKEETELISEYYVGCDEAGVGETFGSMFLGCAVIHKDKLESISNIIQGKNIRQLSAREVLQTYNAISGSFEADVKIYSAAQIDEGSKNVLLDRGYIELLNKFSPGKSKTSIVIDDYGYRNEMKKYIDSLKTQGTEVIIVTKADEQYTACKIASLVARKARIEEVEYINKTNSLVDESGTQLISPGAGSASNPDTEKYLIAYRKKFPSAEFPPFVRKKWNNVIRIEEKYPRQKAGIFLKCLHCTKDLSRIDVLWDQKHGTKFYCSSCANLISVDNFRNTFQKNLITLDTSTLISRIVSKDLNSSKYLEGNTFLLPSFVYEELDRKQPDKKKRCPKGNI